MPYERAVELGKTGVVLTAQYGVITDWDLRGKAGKADIEVSWFASKAAYDKGKEPVQVDRFPLTPKEQTTGRGLLIDVLYAIIAARPEYADVKVV